MNYIERFKELTDRECEILDLFCQGLTYRQIGEKLFIAVPSIKSHMNHIYVKLGLIGLPPKSRAFALREEYWPLVKARLEKVDVSKADETTSEPEIIAPLPPEVEEVIEQDQASMKALVVSKPIELTPPPKPPKPRRWNCLSCLLLLVLLVVGGFAFWYLDGLAIVQDVLAEMMPSLQSPDNPIALNEPTLAVKSPTSRPLLATSTKMPSRTPSRVPTRTPSPRPTNTPTLRPSPTPDFDPVYELGEWHKEGDVWYRLNSYVIDDDSPETISFVVEVWNQTNQDIRFNWNPDRNTWLTDNLGNRYHAFFMNSEKNETVTAQSRRFILLGVNDYTSRFDADFIFNANVYEIYYTLYDFSRLELVSWRISISK